MRKNEILIFIASWLIWSCTDNTSIKSESALDEVAGDTLVYFAEHISPIIYNNCTECHREDGPAPFSMTNYHDVQKRAKTVAYVTQTRYMPPWPADPEYSHFIGEKLLTDEEIELIQKWYHQGTPLGDESKMAAVPEYKDGSLLGEPDLVVKMAEPIPVPGDNKDRFLIVKVPFELPVDTFIRVVEFVPGNNQLVHHMNGHALAYRGHDEKDLHEGKYWVSLEEFSPREAWGEMGIPNEDGTYPVKIPSICNYLPGVQTSLYPRGIGGFRMSKKGMFLINDMHYGPSPMDDLDQSYFNVFYDSIPPKRPIGEFQLGTLGVSPIIPPLVIPPGEKKKFITEYRLPKSISVLTVNPHMHLLGKSFKAYAVKPGNDTIPLVQINDWNFRWQFFYTYKKMVCLPKGTLIKVEALFDNTLANPDNPFNPPQWITGKDGSMKTTDEMLQLIVSYLNYEPGDEDISLEDEYYTKRR